MRHLSTLAFVLVPLGVVAAVFACGGPTDEGPPLDAGADMNADVTGQDSLDLDVVVQGLDASGSFCALDDGSDPVLLCSQYQALQYLVQFAYQASTGVAPGYSSQAPYTAVPGHNWQDDFAFAAALAQYGCSAGYYRNTNTFTPALEGLATIILGEMQEAMGGYDGEVYFQLRNAAVGYFGAMDPTHGNAMSAAAEAYVQNLLGHFVWTVPYTPPPPGDGGVGEAGASDAGASDAGSGADAGPGTSYVIGTHNADGSVSYQPGQAVMAAAALLDMANRYAGSHDAGSAPAQWEAVGTQVLAYLWNRARDPVTGMFYQALVTSSAPGHDTLASSGYYYSPDNLLTDVQGQVILGLARAQAAAAPLVLGDGGVGPDGSFLTGPAYGAEAEQLAVSLTCLSPTLGASCSPSIFDGVYLDPANPPSVIPPAAFMEGYIPSTGLLLTDKTTIGNALVFGGTARASSLGAGTPCVGVFCLSWENAQIRWALSASQANGEPWSPGQNLMSAVVSSMNQVVQLSYLRATSRAYSWATGYVLDGGPDASASGTQNGAMNYPTAATAAMVEGLTQLWYGRQNPPICGY